jgi:hypothetical protein
MLIVPPRANASQFDVAPQAPEKDCAGLMVASRRSTLRSKNGCNGRGGNDDFDFRTGQSEINRDFRAIASTNVV